MEQQRKVIDMELVKSLMREKYYLIHVNYNDDLDDYPKVFCKCIEDGCADHLHEMFDDWYASQEWEAVHEAMENLKSILDGRGYETEDIDRFFANNEDAIREEVYSRGDSDGVEKLLRKTRDIPVRIEMYSNNDCINSHWFESYDGFSYEESYFGDIIDSLNLNPRKVKQLLVGKGDKVYGRFPDLKCRDGKELVSYEQFYEEHINSTCGANLLTFKATLNPSALYESGFNLKKITIPKGNECGLFSSAFGGGSILAMELLRDLTIDLEKKGYPHYGIEIDASGTGYSIKDVYGVTDNFFGKTIQIIPALGDKRISA